MLINNNNNNNNDLLSINIYNVCDTKCKWYTTSVWDIYSTYIVL